ncbi:MAG: c-type cytochrome [Xanthobacteraceae bacterium]
MNKGSVLVATALTANLVMAQALAADADRGRQLAQQRCAGCHVVAPNQRNEVAEAPPFDTIARKLGFGGDALAFALMGPHPKMNFSPTRREADDIAAYMRTLAK